MRAVLFLFLVGCGTEPAAAPAPAPAAPPEPAPVAAPAAAAPAAEGAPAGPGDAAAGQVVYTQFCVACHQLDGTGMNGMLAANFVTDKTRLAKPDAELLAVIRDGVTGKTGTMPPWGTALTAQQRTDALAYIRATFQK